MLQLAPFLILGQQFVDLRSWNANLCQFGFDEIRFFADELDVEHRQKIPRKRPLTIRYFPYPDHPRSRLRQNAADDLLRDNAPRKPPPRAECEAACPRPPLPQACRS